MSFVERIKTWIRTDGGAFAKSYLDDEDGAMESARTALDSGEVAETHEDLSNWFLKLGTDAETAGSLAERVLDERNGNNDEDYSKSYNEDNAMTEEQIKQLNENTEEIAALKGHFADLPDFREALEEAIKLKDEVDAARTSFGEQSEVVKSLQGKLAEKEKDFEESARALKEENEMLKSRIDELGAEIEKIGSAHVDPKNVTTETVPDQNAAPDRERIDRMLKSHLSEIPHAEVSDYDFEGRIGPTMKSFLEKMK